MPNAQTELQVLITAKDEASSKLNSLSKNAKQLGVSFVAVGGAITTAMAFAVKSASDAQVKMASFEATLKTTGVAGEKAKSAILGAADATLKLGFDNEEAAVSIGNLFQRTKNVTEAIKLNNLAMDLARAKNIDLATASNVVGMVLSGNGKVLKQYGIDIKETSSPMEALGLLQTKVAGQAEAFGKTFEGQSQILQQQFGELQEKIGSVLLPVLTELIQKLVPIIDKVMAWTQAHPELTKWIVIITAGIGVLLTVLGTLLLLLPAITTAVSAFGIAITIATGPVGIIIVAIGLLVAALIYLWNNTDEVTKKIKEAWTILADNLKALWEGVKAVAFSVWDAIMGKINSVADAIHSKVQSAIEAFNRAQSILSAPIKSAVNFVTAPLQRRAGGGEVTKGNPFMVGERGPELFVPNTDGSIVPNNKLAGGGGIVININGGTYLSKDVALQIGNMIASQLKVVSRITR